MNPIPGGAEGPAEQALIDRAAHYPEHASLNDLTADALLRVTSREGVDFATVLLFDRFQKSHQHGTFIGRINSFWRAGETRTPQIRATVVIAPGALYDERPEFGSDIQLIQEVAARFGCQTAVIPVGGTGSLMDNARRICDWLARRSDEAIILVSLSKGGADTKLAMRMPDSESLFRKALAWVNVCGPLNGSPLVNWVLANRWRTLYFRAKCRLQRRDFQFIADLRHKSGGPLDCSLSLPPSIKLVSLIGFPLRRHMTTRFSRFCHRTLATQGPSDGTTLLSDLGTWPGAIFPAWGMDHYFRPEKEARKLVAAVFQFLAEELSVVG